MSGDAFWYSDPLRDVKGLNDEQRLWVPGTQALCILWHVGHIAHRERMHAALHFGRIQLLRALIERKQERAC